MKKNREKKGEKSKRIVFDAGGVLFSDGSKELIESIALISGDDPVLLEEWYRNNIHRPLMRGDVDEEFFWREVLAKTGAPLAAKDELRKNLIENILFELPATAKIPKWSEEAEIWILSNHRHEWLLDRFRASGIDIFLRSDRVFISSKIGTRKPEKEAFLLIKPDDDLPTIYIDDKERNTRGAAEVAGVETLLADAEGRWHDDLDLWLAR